MNNYKICQKIKSLVDLFEAEKIDGYTFAPYTDNNGFWLAEKIITEVNYRKAYEKFISEIEPILDAFSVFEQCSIDLVGQSFMIQKLNDNESAYIYFYFSRKTDTVSMCYLKEDFDKIRKLINNRAEMGLYFMRQVNQTSSAYSRLALLLVVVESLAKDSQKRICDNKDCKNFDKFYSTTDKDNLKKILGDDLYKKIYSGERPIRNRLFHGRFISREEFVGFLENIYKSIIEYYNLQFDLKIQDIVMGPRVFDDSNEGGKYFLKCIDIKNLNFDDLYKSFDSEEMIKKNFVEKYHLVVDKNLIKTLYKNY